METGYTSDAAGGRAAEKSTASADAEMTDKKEQVVYLLARLGFTLRRDFHQATWPGAMWIDRTLGWPGSPGRPGPPYI
jgi:hypothetical protein